jgi:hypothetical protein
VAGRRVHDQTGRLVDDEQVGILVDDVQRDRLGSMCVGDGRRHVDLDDVAGAGR